MSDKIICHLDKFSHYYPVKQPEDASFIRQNFRRI